MAESKIAQLDREKLQEILELEEKLDVILIAYKESTVSEAQHASTCGCHSDTVNPS